MKRVVKLTDGDVDRFAFDTDTGLLEIHDFGEDGTPLIQAKMSPEERLKLSQVLADPSGFDTPLEVE